MPLANEGEHRLSVEAEEQRSSVHLEQVMRDEEDCADVDCQQRCLNRGIFRPIKCLAAGKRRIGTWFSENSPSEA
jgi:hypothetical protein